MTARLRPGSVVSASTVLAVLAVLATMALGRPQWLLPLPVLLTPLFVTLRVRAAARRASIAARACKVSRGPLDAAVGTTVALAGRLRIAGAAAAGARDEARAPMAQSLTIGCHRADLCSDELVLDTGDELVPIEGPVCVARGSDEVWPWAFRTTQLGLLASAAQKRAVPVEDVARRDLRLAVLRSVSSGDPVIAWGRLEKFAGDGQGPPYRTVGFRHRLVRVASDGGGPVALIATHTKVLGPTLAVLAWRTAGTALVWGALLLVLRLTYCESASYRCFGHEGSGWVECSGELD